MRCRKEVALALGARILTTLRLTIRIAICGLPATGDLGMGNASAGFAVGIAVGTAIGVAMGNVGMGVAIGVALGFVFGAAAKKSDKKS